MSGTFPSNAFRMIRIASTGTRMSEKRIAASTPSRSIGWIVTSAASSGVLHIVRNEFFPRIFWYSGRYLPACRMIQTGVTSTGSRRHALRNRYSAISTSQRKGTFLIFLIRNRGCDPHVLQKKKKREFRVRPWLYKKFRNVPLLFRCGLLVLSRRGLPLLAPRRQPAFRANGDVVAERFLLEVILQNGVGTGAAAAADVEIFALPAAPLVLLERPKRFEQFGAVPDLPEMLLLHVPRDHGEVGARLDVPLRVDEGDRLRADAPLSPARGKGERPRLDLVPLLLRLLHPDPVVVGGAGGSDEHVGLVLLHLVVPRKDLLVILLADQFVHDLLPPPRGDDHEHVPGVGTDLLGEPVRLRDVVLVPLGEGGVDDELDAVAMERPGGAQGGI